eukprot:TRINITY_DN8015_c0_g1_i2.p1 TRINITY_DN8015_c0_g1~~TRINITY_DN8015_c0_g1_i2.p1  ORF type:complete len:269 (-),score=90.27 TRINITY_DN8015_c0_g1_i2:107-913(-)
MSEKVVVWGNQTTMNMENVLQLNIQASPYFKGLFEYKTYHEVLQEIYTEVRSVDPWILGAAKTPSTAFCLLFKLFTLRLTVKQLQGMLDSTRSVYARALGFLYLRYSTTPKDLWEWFEPYLDDEQMIQPRGPTSKAVPFGRFILQLLTELKYYETILPRIPVPIAREIEKNIKERKDQASAALKGGSGRDSSEREYDRDRSDRDRDRSSRADDRADDRQRSSRTDERRDKPRDRDERRSRSTSRERRRDRDDKRDRDRDADRSRDRDR